MGILQSEGFDALLRAVAAEAAGHSAVADAARYAASLGGRFPARLGLQALTRQEEHLLSVAAAAGARLAAAAEGAEQLALSRTGRLRLLRAGETIPVGDAHPIGAIRWPGAGPAGLDAELDERAAADRLEAQQVATWLGGLPAAEVVAMVEKVRFSLLHMAPVLLYTGSRCYSNLGKRSNLVGKSLKPGAPECVLTRLAATPVASWDIEDARFLGCLHALMTSGPSVRAEEFNGTQLRLDRLATFLRERVTAYGGAVPETTGLVVGDDLHVLARACAEARAAAVARGARPYRLIEGLNFNKQERLERDPVRLHEVPGAVLQAVMTLLECPRPADYAELRAGCEQAMPRLHQGGPDGFTSRFEWTVHQVVRAATEATGSDVGMSRGPRRLVELIQTLRAETADALAWTTKDFFCCVTPSPSFVGRFAAVPDQLPQVLRAISARMRYNGWHYLPHTLGVPDPPPERDWFFAPTMSDVTDWSDQHHTGHVANGVRYAIRVPFGVELVGALRPGLHDFRLMRTAGTPYTGSDLRAAIAVGEVLCCLYQAHAARLEAWRPDDGGSCWDVKDFDNPWHQARYCAEVAAP